MSGILKLARPELTSLLPYIPGVYEPGYIRLNANESPWRAPGDPTKRGLNIYPPPRPVSITQRLSEHYGVSADALLVTRGTSEAIDVLIRGFCAAGRDQILICPPTFDMYRLYAGIQGAEVLTVPLLRADDPAQDFALDVSRVLDKSSERTKLIFVCSPNNPTGRAMDPADVEAICRAVEGRSLVVIDEAYQEFSSTQGFRELQTRYDHVVLLRTLSKFVSLAGVRCGSLIGRPELIEFLGKVLPPYTFPTPSIELVMAALATDSLQVSAERTALLRAERTRLAKALTASPLVRKVWPSDANFILVKTTDGQGFTECARAAGILVRVFPADEVLTDCVRITVGRPEDNTRLLQAVSGEEITDGE
ncbi:MAG: histidinol-phosphate transaminase [Gammaproteobacteria bacterium]